MNETPTRKKIVIGINDLCMGGAQRQLIRQLRYFDTKRYELHVITFFTCDTRTELASQVPSSITIHSFSFSGFLDFRNWFRLAQLLRDLRPNLIVSSLFFSNTILRLLALVLRYSVVAREHNTYTKKRHSQVLIDRILARVSPVIVAVSEEVASFTSAQEHISRERFLVIPNGIDIQEHKAGNYTNVREKLSLTSENKILLSVGRLARQKNLPLLISGFAQFFHQHPEWRLIVVGGGMEYVRLKKYAMELKVGEVVKFCGEQQDVDPYYAMSDAYISTSYIEGMSNTQLEALAHGLPIITPPTGGTSHTVRDGENGYLIPEYTVDAVAATLSKLANSNMEALSAASQKLSAQFDIRDVVRKYEALFDQYAK